MTTATHPVASLPHQAVAGQYPRRTPVQAVARALGCEESTARQYMRPGDPRFLWGRCAAATAGLVEAGHVIRADALCRRIDLARRPRILAVSPEAWEQAREQAQRLDGDEDVAEIFVQDRSSYLTYRRRALRYVDAQLHALRIGDLVFDVQEPA